MSELVALSKDRGIGIITVNNPPVNALSPGAIDTPMIDGQAPTREAADGVRQMYASITPMGRIGNPDEMAKAVLFLASDDSSYTTGIDLAADGGFTQI